MVPVAEGGDGDGVIPLSPAGWELNTSLPGGGGREDGPAVKEAVSSYTLPRRMVLYGTFTGEADGE